MHPTAITRAQVNAALAALGIPAAETRIVTLDWDRVTIEGYAVDDQGRIIACNGEPTEVTTSIYISREASNAAAG